MNDNLTELERATLRICTMLTNLVVYCTTATTSGDFNKLQNLDPAVYEGAIEEVREMIVVESVKQ